MSYTEFTNNLQRAQCVMYLFIRIYLVKYNIVCCIRTIKCQVFVLIDSRWYVGSFSDNYSKFYLDYKCNSFGGSDR